jgi:hypothetical protein
MDLHRAPGGLTINGGEVLRELADRLGEPEKDLALRLAASAEALELAIPAIPVDEAGDASEPEYEWHVEKFTRAEGQEEVLNVAQRMFDYGLIWLANRTLHPFGFAIGVTVNNVQEQKVTGVTYNFSTDSKGITFGDDLEDLGREKFYKALRGVFSRTLGG